MVNIADTVDGQKKYKVSLLQIANVFNSLSRIYLRFNPQADEAAWDYSIDLFR